MPSFVRCGQNFFRKNHAKGFPFAWYGFLEFSNDWLWDTALIYEKVKRKQYYMEIVTKGNPFRISTAKHSNQSIIFSVSDRK